MELNLQLDCFLTLNFIVCRILIHTYQLRYDCLILSLGFFFDSKNYGTFRLRHGSDIKNDLFDQANVIFTVIDKNK